MCGPLLVSRMRDEVLWSSSPPSSGFICTSTGSLDGGVLSPR
jgi:hypothetical protein